MTDNLLAEALIELLDCAETATDPAPILAAIAALLGAAEDMGEAA